MPWARIWRIFNCLCYCSGAGPSQYTYYCNKDELWNVLHGLCKVTEEKLCLCTEPPNSCHVIQGCALRAGPAHTAKIELEHDSFRGIIVFMTLPVRWHLFLFCCDTTCYSGDYHYHHIADQLWWRQDSYFYNLLFVCSCSCACVWREGGKYWSMVLHTGVHHTNIAHDALLVPFVTHTTHLVTFCLFMLLEHKLESLCTCSNDLSFFCLSCNFLSCITVNICQSWLIF